MSRISAICLLSVLLAAAALGACGDDEDSGGGAGDEATAASCSPGQLETVKDGTLTVGTDRPAFPPYFIDNDPTNGRGFESAVAYAIAEELGFGRGQVEWTVVPFNASYAPGPKDFDFDVNQISITPDREKQVDFSTPYYEANQAVVALKGSEAAKATSLEDLADVRFGVQIGTTSLDAVNEQVSPSEEPRVYDNSNDVVSALKQEQVEAVVVDVPTALYLTAVQVPEATVVGQFSAPGGDTWGALLEKDSPLTDCVSRAVQQLDESGELAKIEQRWMSQAAGAPVLD